MEHPGTLVAITRGLDLAKSCRLLRMTVVNVHEAKTQLSRLLERIEAGETITIARAGKPVADLVPHVRADLAFGTLAGLIEFDCDTFDDVDETVVGLFEGR